MDDRFILEMKGITKEFSGVTVLKDVDFRVRQGIVMGLMGENGAGKSTLMKILLGEYTATSGEIVFNGKPLKVTAISEAIRAGISMIHQEISPILEMTIAENIFLGREPLKKTGIVDEPELIRMTQALLDELELNYCPTLKMNQLSIAAMQMVEIVKAISFDSKLIIMDEPTSAITDREVKNLFRIIRKLRSKGVTIVYISHKMDEIFEITDEITVLRDGMLVGHDLSSNLNQNSLIKMMVGRELKDLFPKTVAPIGDIVLEVQGLSHEKYFRDISFHVKAGEIVGFAGLVGSGRSEVLETVFGLRKSTAGSIRIKGKQVVIQNPQQAISLGLGLLTEDRKATGCFLPISVQDNMIMASLGRFIQRGFLFRKRIRRDSQQMRDRMNIRMANMLQDIQYLSGGNQQKVLIARWLLNNPDILIVDEPTRGIDVNAKSEIHRMLCELTGAGKAIIMISSEMPEIIGMSDRIYVMHEGRITGELDRARADQETIMTLASTSTDNRSGGENYAC